MPNWCENELTIKGDATTVEQCLASIKGENGILDFDSIVPTPECLKNTESGSLETYGLLICGYGNDDAYNMVLSYPWVKGEDITTKAQLRIFLKQRFPEAEAIGKKAMQAIQETGYSSWYGWNNANWGTKWNASDPEFVSQTKSNVTIGFNTAWSPPVPVIAALAAKFPTLSFVHKFWEGGMGYKGTHTYKNGEIAKQSDSNYTGSRGG